MIIAALVIVLAGINDLHPLPLPALALDDPTHIAAFDGGLVIADSDGNRLLFTDSSLKVKKNVGLDKDGAPFDFVTDITAVGGRIIISGSKSELNSLYFDCETVAEYSSDGKYISTLYSEQYGEDDYYSYRKFYDVRIRGDGRVVLAVGRDDGIDFLNISEGKGSLIYSFHTCDH